MYKSFLTVSITGSIFFLSQAATASLFTPTTDSDFKHFSVSAGWLHAMPQGDANNMKNSTAVENATAYANGATNIADILPALTDPTKQQTLRHLQGVTGFDPIPAQLAGSSKITTLDNWTSPNTGLEADNADTLGLLFNYYVNDNVSLELKAGIPPKVDIKGKGQVFAAVQGKVYPTGLGTHVLGSEADINTSLPITDLTQGNGTAATAKAWLPAIEAHYQFGKSGVNKFRPYIGAGLIYAYFNDVEINKGVKKDLNIAGQRIQMIKDGKAGASLAPKSSFSPSSDIKVDADATSALAPIVSLGATYDFNDHLYAVGSVSYAKLNNESKITVKNASGEQLIRATTKIDIDPYITYLGIGYRF